MPYNDATLHFLSAIPNFATITAFLLEGMEALLSFNGDLKKKGVKFSMLIEALHHEDVEEWRYSSTILHLGTRCR
jgi:hypothetical protein